MKRYTRAIAITLFVILLCLAIMAVAFMNITERLSSLYPAAPVANGNFPISPVRVFYAEEEIISTPVVQGQIAFIRTSTTLYALDVLENKVVWKVASSFNQKLSLAPIVVDSLVIVVETGSRLAAFSTETGELIWRTPVIAVAETDPVTASIQSIDFNNQFLFVARFDWMLTAYNLKSGETIWDYKLPGRTNPYLQVNENNVSLAIGETVKILDSKTGLELWNKPIDGYSGPILLSNSTLYITDEKNASLISINVNTHQTNWTKDYRSTIEAFKYSCILETEGNILIAAEKLMLVSKSDGSILWATDSLGTLECPIILGNKIFIRNTHTILYALDKETGQEIGRLLVQANTPMKHEPFRSPISVDGLLIVPFGDNRVFVYRP